MKNGMMSVGQTIRLMATSRMIGRGMTSKSMTSMNMTTKDMTNKRLATQDKAKSPLRRSVNLANAAFLSVCSLLALPVLGQPGENEIAPLREAVSAFSDALAGGLGLNAPGGLFGTSVGSVQARYLFGQGLRCCSPSRSAICHCACAHGDRSQHQVARPRALPRAPARRLLVGGSGVRSP